MTRHRISHPEPPWYHGLADGEDGRFLVLKGPLKRWKTAEPMIKLRFLWDGFAITSSVFDLIMLIFISKFCMFRLETMEFLRYLTSPLYAPTKKGQFAIMVSQSVVCFCYYCQNPCILWVLTLRIGKILWIGSFDRLFIKEMSIFYDPVCGKTMFICLSFVFGSCCWFSQKWWCQVKVHRNAFCWQFSIPCTIASFSKVENWIRWNP